jgi:hypothetical protein
MCALDIRPPSLARETRLDPEISSTKHNYRLRLRIEDSTSRSSVSAHNTSCIMSSRCFLRKLYSAVTSLTHVTSADSINSGTPSSDILSAQNVPCVEAGSNTNVTDYDMEQVDAQGYENSPSSTADIMPDLAERGDDHIIDNCLDFQGFDCSSAIGNTDHDCLPCSGLAASTSVDHSSLTALSSECYPSSRNMGECMEADNHLGPVGMESYPTPVSNPSHTPKPANRVQKRRPRKATRESYS